MKKIVLTLLGVFFIFTYKSIAQQEVPIKTPRSEVFTIFGDIPVAHSTGVPDISIPLFNLTSHGYNLPVTLRYHSALVKPPYNQTNVATGWVLEVGGNITQQIRKEDDFKDRRPPTWKTASELNDQWDNQVIDYLRLLSSFDTEYDIFSYSLPGKNGEFIIDQNISNNFDLHFLSDPLYKGKLSGYVNHGLSYSLQSINIIDDSGYTYIYSNSIIDGQGVGEYAPKTRFMDKIKAPTGEELFDFDYQPLIYTRFPRFPRSYNYQTYHDPVYPGINPDCFDIFPTSWTSFYEDEIPVDLDSYAIQKVTYDDGYLEFTLSSEGGHIQKVTLYDNVNNMIKEYEFEFGTFLGEGYRYLHKIVSKDKTGNLIHDYEFTYNNGSSTLSNSKIHTDYWGFLNGNNLDGLLNFIDMDSRTISYHGCGTFHSNYNIGSGYKKPVLNYAKYFTLKTIEYPTGGTTEFVYELNRRETSITSSTEYYGGLRVKEIITNDQKGNIQKKRFEYGIGAIPHTVSPNEAYYDAIQFLVGAQGPADGAYVIKTHHNNKIHPRLGVNNPYYRDVTEYNETDGVDNGKIEYTYSYHNQNIFGHLEDDYYLTARDNINFITGAMPFKYKKEHRDWGNALLTKKSIFKRNGTVYDTIVKETFVYDHQVSQSFDDNLALCKTIQYSQVSSGLYDYYTDRQDLLNDPSYPGTLWTKQNVPYPDPVAPYDFSIKKGAYKLISKTVKQFLEGNELETQTVYNYDNGLFDQLTSVEVSTSETNEKLVSKYLYPTDYTTEPYVSMIDLNMVNPVIQNAQYLKQGTIETLLSTSKTNYFEWFPEVIKPSLVQSSNGISTLQDQVIYHSYYNNGNIKEVSKVDGPHIVYLWGYKEQYPVAKIENTTYAAVTGTMITSELTGIKEGTYNEDSMRTVLNKIRTGLPDAMVTTYTYDPLIGMTSMTDPKGYTMYYVYDDFNRLKYVKDAIGNILSENTYHYKGQYD